MQQLDQQNVGLKMTVTKSELEGRDEAERRTWFGQMSLGHLLSPKLRLPEWEWLVVRVEHGKSQSGSQRLQVKLKAGGMGQGRGWTEEAKSWDWVVRWAQRGNCQL